MQHVVITTPGVMLGKSGERLVVRTKPPGGGTVAEEQIPLFRIEEVVVSAPGVTMSTAMMEACVRRGIKISLLGKSGTPWGLLSSPFLSGAIAARRAQFEAYADSRSVELCRAVVCAKLRNQYALLHYYGKYIRKTDSSRYEAIVGKCEGIRSTEEIVASLAGRCIEDVRNELMGYEGAASHLYWQGVTIIVGADSFPGRKRRGARDPFNAALNYAYGILYSSVASCLINAGLDVYAGFLHADRSGKPSLVLDMIEEFRQPVADRAVLSQFNKDPGAVSMEDGLLTVPARKTIAARVIANLNALADYHGKRIAVNSIMQRQCRTVASFLRGECGYAGYHFKW